MKDTDQRTSCALSWSCCEPNQCKINDIEFDVVTKGTQPAALLGEENAMLVLDLSGEKLADNERIDVNGTQSNTLCDGLV